jgi:flavorubredoxin
MSVTDTNEIADGIYRISTFLPQENLSFDQFLIVDDNPLLFHTGQRLLFPQTVEAVRKVIDPAKLRYISWSHFEADECGALNEFLDAAPQAEPVHGQVGVMVNVNDYAIRPAKAMGDGEVLDLGQKKLRFMVTPHVPHAWDAILIFEETTGTLFASDLFTMFGEQGATTDTDVVSRAMEAYKVLPDYMPIGPHTSRVFDRLEALEPKLIAAHHAPTYTGNAVQALRDLRGELFRAAGLSD